MTSPTNRAAYRFPTPPEAMAFTGERYVTGYPGDIQSEHYHRYLLALRYCEGRDVLDVASGEGYGSALLSQAARSVLGVDLDAASVAFANRHYLGERVSFRRGEATALPVADASVDAVVSFETIEHLVDHGLFLDEVCRVLRPGGIVVISSPDRRVYSEEPNHENPFHLKELSRPEFLALLRDRFAHAVMLEQRALAGSVILRAAETGTAGPVEGFASADGAVFERFRGVPDAPYLVAVASNDELPEVPHSVMHTQRRIHHLEELREREAHAAGSARAEAREALARAEALGREADEARAAQRAQEEQARAHAARTEALSGELAAARDSLERALAEAAAERGRLVEEAEAAAKREAERERLFEEAAAEASRGAAEALSERERLERRLRDEMDRLSAEAAAGRAELAGRLDSAVAACEQVSREADRLSAEGQESRARAEAAEAEAAALRRELRALRGSASWRATAPLRSALSRSPSLSRLGHRSATFLGWTLSGRPVSRLRQHLAWRREAERLRAGFDAERYLRDNPDVAEAGADPLWHYVTRGRAEGR